MVLVDSSVWIVYFNGAPTPETERLDALLGLEPVGLGDLILAEVLQGFRLDKDYRTARKLLTSLTIYDLLGRDLAIRAADNYRMLRKQGITVRKTTDVIIASFCIQHDLPLLHADKDFLPFVEHLNLRTAL
ncbi:MAG TPA: PIN domain nuclease [Gammaproteobacteria bacterium]|nr:PIN domain nuclease [Gammaproteobacteria bacterium]